MNVSGSVVGNLLKERGQTLAIAESSAGGLINAALVAVPGASAWYLGGCIVYTGTSRAALLGITPQEMAGLRPASEVFARLLAQRTRERLGAVGGERAPKFLQHRRFRGARPAHPADKARGGRDENQAPHLARCAPRPGQRDLAAKRPPDHVAAPRRGACHGGSQCIQRIGRTCGRRAVAGQIESVHAQSWAEPAREVVPDPRRKTPAMQKDDVLAVVFPHRHRGVEGARYRPGAWAPACGPESACERGSARSISFNEAASRSTSWME